ncbi:MAG: M23 family metallopeptidase [Clostridiales bacterium]|nr:M23 family metallopeptidase [Clostridiales bacterium]
MRITTQRSKRPRAARTYAPRRTAVRRDTGERMDRRLFLQLSTSAVIICLAVLVSMVGGGVKDGMISSLERTSNLSDINETLQQKVSAIPVIGRLFDEEKPIEVFGGLFEKAEPEPVVHQADGTAADGYTSYTVDVSPAQPMFLPGGAPEEAPFESNFDQAAFDALPDIPDDTDGGVSSAAVGFEAPDDLLSSLRFMPLAAGEEPVPQEVEVMAQPVPGESLPDNCTFEEQALAVSLSIPLSGTITSVFGAREARTKGGENFHHGLDIAAPSGSAIRPVAAGAVLEVGFNAAYGNYLVVQHEGGLTSKYAHCTKILVKQGDKVKTSTKIATVGSTGESTGSHLHLELRLNGVFIDPAIHLGLAP